MEGEKVQSTHLHSKSGKVHMAMHANSENKQQQAQPEGNKNENLSEDLALNRLSWLKSKM